MILDDECRKNPRLRRGATSWRPLAAGAVFAIAAGCSDSSGPSLSLGARYELTSYAGHSLPYTWRGIASTNGFQCADQITGGRLLFGPDRSALDIQDRALVCNDGSAPVISNDTAQGQYTLSGNHLEMHLSGMLVAESNSPYEVSATLTGSVIQFDQLVSHTGASTITDHSTQIFALAP